MPLKVRSPVFQKRLPTPGGVGQSSQPPAALWACRTRAAWQLRHLETEHSRVPRKMNTAGCPVGHELTGFRTRSVHTAHSGGQLGRWIEDVGGMTQKHVSMHCQKHFDSE